MAYNTGTITSATPATALVAVLEAELTSHGGWTFMSNVTIATKTYRVWRCNSTNAFGTAFFIFFDFLTAGTGSVIIKGMEDWETGGAAASRARRIITANQNTAPHATKYSLNDTTDYALDSSLFDVNLTISTNTTGFTWRTQTSANRLIVATNLASSGMFYIGLFESLMTSDPFPICSQGAANGGLSRIPGVTAAGGSNFLANIRRYIADPATNITIPDPIWGYAVSSRVLIGGPSTPYGYFRGLLRDCVICSATGAVGGDTITIAGATYTYFPTNTLAIWVANAAP